MSILKSQPDVKEWSEMDERPGRWVGITTWVECLAVERNGAADIQVCVKKVYPLRLAAEGGQEKYEQFFQQFNDTMHK